MQTSRSAQVFTGSIRRNRRLIRATSLASAVVAVFGLAQPASAIGQLFTNGNGTNLWEDAGNWIGLTVPAAGDRVYLDGGATVNTSVTGNVCEELQVGVGPNAYGNVGNPGGTATLNILSGGAIVANGNMVVGQCKARPSIRAARSTSPPAARSPSRAATACSASSATMPRA
ncbi:MAG: hypothetical protein QM770_01365 [Tepidisphaeraceae bacterium]